MARADGSCKFTLEPLDAATLSDPAGAQGVDDLGDLLLADRRNAEREELGASRLAAVDGELFAQRRTARHAAIVLVGVKRERGRGASAAHRTSARGPPRLAARQCRSA